MNRLRISMALLIGAALLPAAHAQQVTGQPASDLLPHSMEVQMTTGRAPWIASAPVNPQIVAVSHAAIDVSDPQVELRFADEVPLQPNMFDSATAWEDEP